MIPVVIGFSFDIVPVINCFTIFDPSIPIVLKLQYVRHQGTTFRPRPWSVYRSSQYAWLSVEEVDMIFPRNGTFGPMTITPIGFTIQNPEAIDRLYPYINYGLWRADLLLKNQNTGRSYYYLAPTQYE